MDSFDREQLQQLAGFDEALELLNKTSLALRGTAAAQGDLARIAAEHHRAVVRWLIDLFEDHRVQFYGARSGITDQTLDELRADDARMAAGEQP